MLYALNRQVGGVGLGTNSSEDGFYPFPVYTGSGLTGVVTAVDAGEKHSLALTNGAVWAWGENAGGRLGCNSNHDKDHPVQVHGSGNVGYFSGVTQVAAGWHHSLAVTSDGSVWAWGNNDYGQLGIGNRDNHQIPCQVHGPDNVGFLTDIGAPPGSAPPDDETGKPEVKDMTPAPGAADVFRRTAVTATFSEEMDTSTLTEENFRLYELSAKKGLIRITNVRVAPSLDGTTVTLDPHGTSGKALGKDTEHVAVVTTGVRDLDGNAMARHKLWRFETGSRMKE